MGLQRALVAVLLQGRQLEQAPKSGASATLPSERALFVLEVVTADCMKDASRARRAGRCHLHRRRSRRRPCRRQPAPLLRRVRRRGSLQRRASGPRPVGVARRRTGSGPPGGGDSVGAGDGGGDRPSPVELSTMGLVAELGALVDALDLLAEAPSETDSTEVPTLSLGESEDTAGGRVIPADSSSIRSFGQDCRAESLG